MASVWATRALKDGGSDEPSVITLDGAKKIGAKILVAGGGRCNATHHAVDELSYAGSAPSAIKKVLRRWPVSKTIEFFEEQGVTLKREETGKLFPTTDKARTVLEALKNAAGPITHPWRVDRIAVRDDHEHRFVIEESRATAPDGIPRKIYAKRVILAAGGRALPKSGSDGAGHRLAKSLGHTVTGRVFPALVPLRVEGNHFVRELSGIASDVECSVRLSSGKIAKRLSGAALCTHFGLSGPCPMNISRYYADAKLDDPNASLVINWLPGETFESVDRALTSLGAQTIGHWIRSKFPERLARALCANADVLWETAGGQLTKEARKSLARALTEMPIPITGDRGWDAAEVTAGGVPLDEVDLKTMESRGETSLMEFTIPARGLIGMRNRMLTATNGTARPSTCLAGRLAIRSAPAITPSARQLRKSDHFRSPLSTYSDQPGLSCR